MPRYDVFLSHASADKPAVEHLARKLREAGLEPFLDTWCLVAGEPWQEALEEAVHQSDCCAVFFGPVSKGGAWRAQETQLALARAAQDPSFRVIPVLLPRSKADEVAGFLSLRTWVDFREGLDDAGALTRLIASIRAEPPGPEPHSLLDRYRCMAPAREPFVQRSEYAKVRDALLIHEVGSSESATTVGITTAIHGAGGFGKTALAIELCYDDRIREQFSDGVLWTTMGEEIEAAGRLARIHDLIRWWTEEEPPAFETVSAASAHLRQELAGKRVLLVVDDVWRPEDVAPFQGLGPKAALLLTTWDNRTLPAESVPIHVDAMEVPEAVRLLGAGLPDATGVDLRGLATRLGEWPLLLKIVNRQLRELTQKDGLSLEQSFLEVNEALDAEGLTVFDREDFESRGQAVAQTVGASLRRLSGEEVGRFEQLAILPEDKDIPLRALEKLWELGFFAAKKLCSRLHDLSLLLRFDRQTGTIRLHGVIRAYLLKRGESRLSEWHRRFLDAFRPANGRWPDLPREEIYLWTYMIHHLIGAGQSDVCRDLLLDFHYLGSKLGATDINALLADYSSFAEQDKELRLVRDALRLSAHVLGRSPIQLREQLWGRLLDRQEAGIQSLLREREALRRFLATAAKDKSYPARRSLDQNHRPSRRPTALAVLPDGRVVSGSADGMLRVWSLESGQPLQTLEGHSDSVLAVTVLDNFRVVSGSIDGTLRVWDLESGQALKVLEAHSDTSIPTPDGHSMVFESSDDGTLWVWDAESGQELQVLEHNTVLSVAMLDIHRVASGCGDGTLCVWDVESGQALQVLKEHSDPLFAVAALDSRRVVSCSSDGTLRVWEVDSGQTLQILETSRRVSAVATMDSRRVILGFSDGTLWVWDVEKGKALQVLKGQSIEAVTAVAVLDSYRVVSGSRDGMLCVWDAASGEILRVYKESSEPVFAVAALDNHRVVSGSLNPRRHNGMLRVCDLESDEAVPAIEGHSSWVTSVAVLDSNRVVSVSRDGTLWTWDVDNGRALPVLQGQFAEGLTAVAALDSRRVVSGSRDRTLQVWDVKSGGALHTLHGHSGCATAVAVIDSRRVVSGSRDRTLRVWDVESGKALQILQGHSGWVTAVAALDSRRVISGSRDKTLRVWDVESGKALQVLKVSSKVRAVAVLDDRRVISGSDDRTLRVWDVESGRVLKVLEGHSDWVRAVAALDSRRVVSGSDDHTLRVWDVERGEVECLFTLDAPVNAVGVLVESCVIVAGDGSGRVHFFDFIEATAR